MLKQLGAEVLGEVTVDKETNEKLWMIRIDLANPLPNHTMLTAMTQKKPKERPSL